MDCLKKLSSLKAFVSDPVFSSLFLLIEQQPTSAGGLVTWIHRKSRAERVAVLEADGNN